MEVVEKICPENLAAFENVYPEDKLYEILYGNTAVTNSVVMYDKFDITFQVN